MKRWKQSSGRCQGGSSSSKDQRTKKHVGRSLTSCSEGSSEVRGKQNRSRTSDTECQHAKKKKKKKKRIYLSSHRPVRGTTRSWDYTYLTM